jgi:hypothetical protein
MTSIHRLFAPLLLAATAGTASAQTVRVDFLEFSKAWGSVVADFNKDGHDDIFVTGHDSDDRIWYWTPTGYVPAGWTLPWQDRHACTVADVNKDGLLDMFCAIGGEKGFATKKGNELWIQQPNGSFVQAQNTGVEDPYGRGRHPVFLDLNHDGWPDLYLTNDATPRTDGQPNWNHLFVNQKNGTFAEVQTIATGMAGTTAPGFQCAVKGDVNGDGWDDLLVCYESGPGHIYVNNHANDFTALATPAYGNEWIDAKLADVNGDGRDDLVIITKENHVQVWLNTGVAPYYTAASYDYALPGTTKGQSVAIGDFNGDGKKDLYVVLASACQTAGPDTAGDVLFKQTAGPSWKPVALAQSFDGCGHEAATIDGTKILLENGTPGLRGPNFVLTFQ